ncbi:magnesium transporter [Alkalicoccobacillus gibsonii]|uniref:magnesium transporter n=1 Tax=Alkalicoccobacillus gibsonii TaxID=79881 RepID=UPI003F7C5EC1
MHSMTLKSIMSTDFLSYVDTLTVKEALYQLKTTDRSSTSPNVYVVNADNKLIGSLSFKELATSDQHAPISDIMSSTCLSLRLHEDLDKVSKQIKETNDVAIPIINESNHMIGVVTTNDLRRTLEVDADFALSPLAGAGKRAPWLVLLMIVGLLTGGVIKHFEQALESVVLLAIFIPLVMGSAGNIGTQSLAIVVRGLSLGTFSRKAITLMLKKQLGTGILTGLACGFVITILISLLPYFGGSWLIGSIVGVAICLSLSITCLIGAIVPLILYQFKMDPAFASGPCVTAISDILSLFIYFYMASALLDYL